MSNLSPAWTMIVLDVLMVIYTLWAISTARPLGKLGPAIGASMLAWLGALHLGLTSQSIFPRNISGVAFLIVIFVAVGAVGAVLMLVPRCVACCWASISSIY